MTETSSTGHAAPAENFLPGPVLLLGAPGVGKGTQAKLLMAAFSIPQISTGDILRQNRKDHTPLGLMAEEIMQRGELVPDKLINDMVAGRLAQPDCTRGYILDGFPRTLAQAEWIDTFLAEHENAMLPLVAINIKVEHDELLQRITGRRISPAGRIYNIYSNPPQRPGICDVDGSTLEQRSDDSEEVFEQRMKIFYEQTAPVIEFYRKHDRFQDIDGSLGIDQVTANIISALERFRGVTV